MTRVVQNIKPRKPISRKWVLAFCIIFSAVGIVAAIMLLTLVFMPMNSIEKKVDRVVYEAYEKIDYCERKNIIINEVKDDDDNIYRSPSVLNRPARFYARRLYVDCDDDSYVTVGLEIRRDSEEAKKALPEATVNRRYYETDKEIESKIPGAKAKMMTGVSSSEVIVLDGGKWDEFDKNYRELLLNRIKTVTDENKRYRQNNTSMRMFVLMVRPSAPHDYGRIYLSAFETMGIDYSLSNLKDYKGDFVDESYYCCEGKNNFGKYEQGCSVIPIGIQNSEASKIFQKK